VGRFPKRGKPHPRAGQESDCSRQHSCHRCRLIFILYSASQKCPEDGFAICGMTPNAGSAWSYLDIIENEKDNNRATFFPYTPDQYLFSGCPSRGIDFDPRVLQGTRIPCILRCLLRKSVYIPIKLLRGMVSIAACRLHLGISHAQARYKEQ
jgi:hypothetical protein